MVLDWRGGGYLEEVFWGPSVTKILPGGGGTRATSNENRSKLAVFYLEKNLKKGGKNEDVRQKNNYYFYPARSAEISVV